MTRLLALVWPALRAEEGEQALFDAMLDRLDDLSPRIEAVDRGVALVDITGLGPLLGDERRIAARAVALTRGVAQLPVRAGVGDNRWLAVLAARLARPQRERRRPPSSPSRRGAEQRPLPRSPSTCFPPTRPRGPASRSSG